MGLCGIGGCGGVKRVQWDLGIETVRPFRRAHAATSEVCAESEAAAAGTFTADAAAVKSSA